MNKTTESKTEKGKGKQTIRRQKRQVLSMLNVRIDRF